MLLLLIACTDTIQQSDDPLDEKDPEETGADTAGEDTGADTGDTSETGETGDSVVYDSAEGDYPYNCGELTSPITVSTHDGFLLSLPLAPLDRMSVELAITRATEWRVAAGGDCEEVVIDGAGRTILDGDCTSSSGASFAGLAVSEGTSDGTHNYEFDEFSVTYDDGESAMYFWADGTLSLTMEGQQTIDMHYIYQGSGTSFPPGEVELIRHQETSQEGFTIAGKGYVEVISSTSWSPGELCFDVSYASDMATCPMEPIGTATLTGDAVVDGVMDGDVACDACINMVVDGVDQGSVCP